LTPDLVRWARLRERLTPDEAAKRAKVEPARFVEWETGQSRPTLRQAQELAHQLRIPFGYLFLSKPPQEVLPLPDLRTVADQEAANPSPELLDVVNDAVLKQEWYREYQLSGGAAPLPFVGRFSVDGFRPIAKDIQGALGDDLDLERRPTVDPFLRALAVKIEALGILVLRSGVVGNNAHRKLRVEEFRGFVISDRIAPLIFINAQDAKVAQIFTLLHELAHLWLGKSGITNPEYGQPSERSQLSVDQSEVERLCNRTAAEVLVPSDDLRINWNRHLSPRSNVEALTQRYRVSRQVILRQALDLERVSLDDYWEAVNAFVHEAHSTGVGESSGGNFYATLLVRSSRTFVTALTTALAEGQVTHRDAARLLNVKVGTLPGVTQHMLQVETAE
jgi:Zn-dependent peptidase ImmA (M78 family)/transcriptional regulator with XRE-family HTH domain